MKIDGKSIASVILEDLKLKVNDLAKDGIVPTLAVILMGNNESSDAYVRQKELKAAEIGAKTLIYRFNESVDENEIEDLVKKLDSDKNVHGIILQRPAPKYINAEKLEKLISPKKEVDGFGENSLYPVPVAQAVILALKKVYENEDENGNFEDWLKSKSIIVLGKGETAGFPIINHFRKIGVEPEIIDSKTQNKNDILSKADIIISAVGKPHTFEITSVKKGVILIGVGLTKNNEGKLVSDFSNEDAEKVTSFYSPTPGGVGPINVACLMENLVKACILNNPLTNSDNKLNN